MYEVVHNAMCTIPHAGSKGVTCELHVILFCMILHVCLYNTIMHLTTLIHTVLSTPVNMRYVCMVTQFPALNIPKIVSLTEDCLVEAS